MPLFIDKIRFHLFHFYQRSPSLFLALYFLIGSSCAIVHSFWPLFFLLFFLFLQRSIFLILSLALIGFFYTHLFISPVFDSLEGGGYFSIQKISPYASTFQKGWLYKGNLKSFVGKEGKVRNVPCSIISLEKRRYPASTDYFIRGTLRQKDQFFYFLKPEKDLPWTPLSTKRYFPEKRYRAKQALRKNLQRSFSHPEVFSVLSALSTGDLDNRYLQSAFQRLGLSHLLAISGFHFGLVTGFVLVFLRKLTAYRFSFILLSLLIGAYALFIGPSPSVFRTWLVLQLYFLGKFFGKTPNSLNLLGIAILVELAKYPLISLDLSFQLSYLSTAGILLFHSSYDHLLSYVLKKRSIEEIDHLTRLAQHGYLFSGFLRKAFALTLSVNTMIFPLLLFHFHKFSLLSLVYNLFFPFVIAISIATLWLSLFLQPLFPFLAVFLHSCNEWLTKKGLELTFHPPKLCEFFIRTPSFSVGWVWVYLFILFFLSIFLVSSPRNPFSQKLLQKIE